MRQHFISKSSRTLTKKPGTAKAIPDFFWKWQKDLVSAAGWGAAPQWGAPSTDRGESRDRRGRASLALAHPSARGFEVDVRTAHKEQGRAGVVRFFSQERKRVVLIWCCGKTFRGKAVFKSPLLEGLPPRDRIHITHRGLNRHRRLGRGFPLYPRRPYR